MWRPRRKFRDRLWLHILLFLLTVASTMLVGSAYYLSWITELGAIEVNLPASQLFFHGWWFGLTFVAILGAHEFGHYFACRYYDVDASLPFFLPMPLGPSGSLGAVIRIREPIPSKRMLFDIGIAGPIAGFVVAAAALVAGMALSSVVPHVSQGGGIEFGEPPLFQLVSYLMFGTVGDGYTVNVHPMAFAAWWGFLVTALNLFPAGQLDGGHIAYAVMGRQSTILTVITIVCAAGLTFLAITWVVWTLAMVAMILIVGPHHPRTFDESVPLDAGRTWLALCAVIIFVLCFTPVPLTEL